MKMEQEQRDDLYRALDLIGRVQVALCLREDKIPQEERDERWRQLYKLRIDLSNFVSLSD
jgi:hypothetical protein